MYEDIEETEYLDLSKRKLGVNGILDIFKDLAEDHLLKQVDLSYNIISDEFFQRDVIENFLKKLKYYLSKNTGLIALDLAGNYLFHYHPHPTNEHIKNYEKELANALLATKVSRIDLSDNNISGHSGRELDGFIYFCKNYMCKRQALQIRNSLLTSQGFHALTHCLGVHSSLTYLDVSDNMGGLDAHGNQTSEGILHFARILSQTIHLKVLKIARNHLRDKEIDLIANAVHDMAEFRDLDIAGNVCKYYSCRSLKSALISHGVSYAPGTGFRELNLSTNPIGDEGIKEISIALRRTQTLRILRISNCGITEVGGQWLQDALAENSTVVVIDAYGNLMSPEQESLVVAEIEANEHVEAIRNDPMSVDAESLYIDMYLALARKLRFLERDVLAQLHSNPSFNTIGSEMRSALHILEPPPRQILVKEVIEVDKTLEQRLKNSREALKKTEASKKIFTICMKWHMKRLQKKSLMAAVLEAQRREREMISAQLAEDDMSLASYASSLESKSTKSFK